MRNFKVMIFKLSTRYYTARVKRYVCHRLKYRFSWLKTKVTPIVKNAYYKF